MSKKLYFYLSIAWAFVILYFATSVPSESSGQAFVANDKIMHFAAFGILAIFLSFSEKFSKLQWPMTISFVYAAMIEIVQFFIPYRTFDLLDLAAGALGVFAILLVIPDSLKNDTLSNNLNQLRSYKVKDNQGNHAN